MRNEGAGHACRYDDLVLFLVCGEVQLCINSWVDHVSCAIDPDQRGIGKWTHHSSFNSTCPPLVPCFGCVLALPSAPFSGRCLAHRLSALSRFSRSGLGVFVLVFSPFFLPLLRSRPVSRLGSLSSHCQSHLSVCHFHLTSPVAAGCV